jgi:hypothetical protein
MMSPMQAPSAPTAISPLPIRDDIFSDLLAEQKFARRKTWGDLHLRP